jgi:hypothetical protein
MSWNESEILADRGGIPKTAQDMLAGKLSYIEGAHRIVAAGTTARLGEWDEMARGARLLTKRLDRGTIAPSAIGEFATHPTPRQWNSASDLPDESKCFRGQASMPATLSTLHGVVFDILVGSRLAAGAARRSRRPASRIETGHGELTPGFYRRDAAQAARRKGRDRRGHGRVSAQSLTQPSPDEVRGQRAHFRCREV